VLKRPWTRVLVATSARITILKIEFIFFVFVRSSKVSKLEVFEPRVENELFQYTNT